MTEQELMIRVKAGVLDSFMTLPAVQENWPELVESLQKGIDETFKNCLWMVKPENRRTFV
jgi:hypothetical protein